MSGMMMSNIASIETGRGRNEWTGTTTGLEMNLLNAPSGGSIWYDVSGKGRNGTVRTAGTGSSTYSSGSNGGLTFASGGSTNAAMISTDYNMVNGGSVEVVANFTPSTFPAYVFGNDFVNGGQGWWAYFFSSTVFKVGSVSRENLYTITGNTGSTRQFTFVFNTTPSIDFYVNGSLQSPFSSSYGLAPSPATNGINFNSRHPADGTSNVPTETGTGTYYQMRVYSTSLNQTQVTANYNAIKTTYGI